MTIVLLCCLISYLLGSLPFGYWIGKYCRGIDIRTVGSRNIDSTNVYRVLGFRFAAIVFLLDTLKGAAAVLLARWLLPMVYGQHADHWLAMPYLMLIGLCAVVGHNFSCLLRFKGGRGVAASLGVLLALCPLVALLCLCCWGVVVAATRYVSLASLVAAVSFPISAALFLHGVDRSWMLGLSLVLVLMVIIRHQANINRLLHGTEPKIGQRVEIDG